MYEKIPETHHLSRRFPADVFSVRSAARPESGVAAPLRRAGRSLRQRRPATAGVFRRLRPADTVQPIFASEFCPKNRFLLSCIFFFCAFVLIQKHQKIKHGEKQRVTTPALTERAQKTPLLRRNPLRRFDCGGSAKSASGLCVRLLNVVLHTHSWRSPVAVTSSATFAVRSGRPETC